MKLRTAILGYGRNGSTMHAGAIANNADAFDLTAVCDTDPARRQQARERFGCTVYADYHEMLSRESLDLVSIVTRSDQHSRMACDCLAAGVNVLVTKPWAVNAAEAERMIAAAAASGRQLLPWLPVRWSTDLRRLRELVTAGTIGNVFLIRRLVACFSRRNDWQTERQYGGGYLLNWGPHIVDSAVLLKAVPVKSVYAAMRQTLNPGDTEDLFLAVFTLADGTLVTAEHTVAIEGLPNWFVQGDQGTIAAYGDRLVIHQHTPAMPDDPTHYPGMKAATGTKTEETIGPHRYGDENAIYAEIAQALRGEKPYPVQPADALGLTRLLDAIRLSSETNRVISLP
ncbi:MAG: putative oxidoreductase YvaA [Lentisphaerae bacterium ADurb.BinA184]|nr:MAG: putative oxidoreductase YvaA [Lentisphaerae bacterium ADurb.BinA184]